MGREWSSQNTNLSVDQVELYVGYRSVIAAVSEAEGVDHCAIHSEAINTQDFVKYLKDLRAKHKRKPLTLFMDKLPVHRAKEVTTVLQELNMVRIFNVGYFPEGNPIEAVFSKVKSIFCRRRSNCLINKVGFNMDREIENAFQ